MLETFRVDPSRTSPPPEPANFVGEVRMQNLHRAAGATSVEALVVHFPAGGRTRPHTHPGEQVLHFVGGDGFVHLAGEEAQRVPQGSVVIVPAGVVHMHGALADAPTVHVALRAANGPTDWEPDAVPEEWRRYSG